MGGRGGEGGGKMPRKKAGSSSALCVFIPLMQEGYIYIKTHLNGFVLDVDGGNEANGAKVISRPVASQPADNQLWRLDYQPDKTFLVVSKLAGGKVLDCSNQKQGTQLVVCERHGGENQRWKREGDHLTSMSGLVADISGCNKSPGAAVVLWSKHKDESPSQLFSFVTVRVDHCACGI